MTACDQCQGELFPCDLLSNLTTCVECARAALRASRRGTRAVVVSRAEVAPAVLRDRGQELASVAHSEDRAKVDAAIVQLASTGRPFSANDARSIHGVKGGVVGAAFTAARKAGLIERISREPSSAASTHGHEIGQWLGLNTRREAA